MGNVATAIYHEIRSPPKTRLAFSRPLHFAGTFKLQRSTNQNIIKPRPTHASEVTTGTAIEADFWPSNQNERRNRMNG